ncbi:hypothetical protein CTAYLR_008920 [Chrysophaeum taylorii]|uniref:Uncharacterized protein n=1 Tax=Chrysophaeum taylorii TaxID=2483200 RepID=A0AAD7UBQ2_9STRA|nr:hypothetical protein CTAYLR_008920 [Chrysophaeum taylorii]
MIFFFFFFGVASAEDIYGCYAKFNLSVVYGKVVECGTVVPYSTAHYSNDPPNISFASASPGTYYTVAMVDPDAPSPEDPSYREVRHYLVANIDANALLAGDFSKADVLSAFVNPSPPNASGYHRYVQLAYEQPGELAFGGTLNASILNFNITAFADEYGLQGPVASNFFLTQYECSDAYTTCGGGPNAEAPIACCDDSFACFEQNSYYYQCLTACPVDWACNESTSLDDPDVAVI